MSGTPSPKQSSSSGSAASFIKTVQNLIQSDDQEILAKKMIELQIQFPVIKKLNANMSNQEKLSYFLRDNNFRQKLFEKLLQNFGAQKNPPIKISLYSIRYRAIIQGQLDEVDLIKIFDRFGKISFIYVDKIFAYLQFQSLISSYLAIQSLNQFEIIRDSLRLEVRWCRGGQQNQAEQYFFAKFHALTDNFGENQKNQKFNCKYNLHLSCPPEFKIAQKIIGPKGNNIKKIFQQISNKYKAPGIQQIQKSLKMRLRGKGSGYKEGIRNQQSDQILNFCISSKQKYLYDAACFSIQKIFNKLASDYKFEYQRVNHRQIQGTVYRKFQWISNNYVESKQLKLEDLSSNLHAFTNSSMKKLTQTQIQQQINKRNKARKAGKYKQADQIREKLKLNGVILIDGSGKRNIYTTTWKYIDQ